MRGYIKNIAIGDIYFIMKREGLLNGRAERPKIEDILFWQQNKMCLYLQEMTEMKDCFIVHAINQYGKIDNWCIHKSIIDFCEEGQEAAS